MARKLKTYQTSLGFFDLAVAAPSMKAALEAWGADSNLFHQGAARQSEDPHIVAATMAAPGVVLKRPVGSSGPSKSMPSCLPISPAATLRRRRTASRRAASTRGIRSKLTTRRADRKAALAFEKEQKRRERERAKEEAAQRKERERRQKAIKAKEKSLDAARRKHEKNATDIQAQIELLEKRAQAEEARWEKERSRLDLALRRARG